MFSRSKVFVMILVLMLIVLSACGPELEVSPVDPGGDGEQQVSDQTDKGMALVHYHILVKHPDAEFMIEPIIPVEAFPGSNPGSYKVAGVTDINVQMRMGADREDNRCNVHCNINLKYTAEGEITLDENTGKCIIPMSFTFTPEQDNWILESDCPDELEAVLDCTTLSVHMQDPSIYTFEANKRDVSLPAGNGVTLRAELLNFTMPSELKGLCNW